MAYADQTMSGNRIVALIIVAIIHLAVGYALVTGLAYSATRKLLERVTTIDIEEPPPTEEPPPPPEPKDIPPPPVAPPPPINISVAPPPIRVQQEIPVAPPAPPIRIVAPAAPPPPPPPPNPPTPRGRTSNWVTTNDYPRRALREEQEGTTRVDLTVGLNGKVESCTVTSSSGFQELDEAVCKNVTRRARFKPGTRDGQEVVTHFPFAVTWRIPQD